MANKSDYKVATVDNASQTKYTVASGSTTSPIIDCGGCAPAGLILDGAFTSCNISFLGSKYGTTGTFKTLVNFDGTALSVAAAANEWIPLQPSLFCGIHYLQLEFSATQTSTTVVDVAMNPYFQGIHS